MSGNTVDINRKLELEPIRTGFGRGLLSAGKTNSQVYALCADLTESTQMHMFADQFPQRFVNVGVAEQNLVTVASGLASMGKIPFCSSYAAFNPGRNWEQIRTTVCLNDQPVKVVGSHAGISVGPDGATHQMLEDISLMRVLPNMVVVAPADSTEAEKATIAIASDPRPTYIRLARESTPVFMPKSGDFSFEKAKILRSGKDITLIGTGTMTYQCLVAAEILMSDQISAEVIHVPVIKPIDSATIVASAVKTGAVITAEEHQINGALGGSVCEILSEHHPTPVKRVGIADSFGQSGTPEELMTHYSLTGKQVAAAAHGLLHQIER